MSILTLLLIIFVSVIGIQNNAFAVTEIEIADLVSKLGANSFEDRNEASDALLKIGKPARKALEIAVESNDPEIRMRARKILYDIKLGINPAWSEELRQKMRGFNKLDKTAKKKLIDKLTAESENEAMSFLLMRVEKGDPSDVDMVIERLLAMKDKEMLWKKVLAGKEPPSNKYQARMLALACQWSGKFSDILKVLGNKHLEKSTKNKLLTARIEALGEYLEERNYKKAEEQAGMLSKAVSDNAIILYLQAEALSKLGRNREAVEIEEKALELNPESEAPHYTAGTKLMEMGKYRLAEREWKMILDIPPHDDVYDINAYIRLSDIYARSGLFIQALNALETGVKKYKTAKEKRGSGMGMVGAESLDGKIEYLRKKANAEGDAAGMQIKDRPPKKKTYLKCSLNIIVKDNKYEEMVAELKKVERSMTLNVEPRGLKLLQKKVLKLKYDKEKHQFSVMLNNTPCSVEKNFELKQESAKVAVYDQDVCNIYKVDRDTEKVELLKSFEKDYHLKITKGKDIGSWKDTVLKVNDKEYSWQDMKKGISFDFLPKKLKIDLKGVTQSGKEKTISLTVDPANINQKF